MRGRHDTYTHHGSALGGGALHWKTWTGSRGSVPREAKSFAHAVVLVARPPRLSSTCSGTQVRSTRAVATLDDLRDGVTTLERQNGTRGACSAARTRLQRGLRSICETREPRPAPATPNTPRDKERLC